MTGFQDTLRQWRRTRRMSQLDLALEAGVSARHISFLETGRSRPSRDMIGCLADALSLPLAARNRMLTGAGFAARYVARDWSASEMTPVRMAVDRMLERHRPFPALAVDRLWTVLAMTPGAAALFAPLGLRAGGSLLNLMTSPVLPEVVENWPEVAHHAALRLRTESAAQGGVPELDAVAEMLGRVPRRDGSGTGTGPVVPAIYRMGDERLSLFATIAQFGTPEDLTLDDLKVELYFPADDATRAALEALDRG